MITEIVRMKCVEGITKEAFIAIVDGLERHFHAKQKGFVDTELLYLEADNEWFMIQHWEFEDDMKAASKQIFADPMAEAFVKSLDKHSVKMTILSQEGVWKV